jgi:hypothetical protein
VLTKSDDVDVEVTVCGAATEPLPPIPTISVGTDDGGPLHIVRRGLSLLATDG